VGEAGHRLYRFGLRDRSGWLLGLDGAQTISLGVGVLGAGLALNAGAPAVLVLAPLAAAAVFGFAVWNTQPVRELAPTVLGWAWARACGQDRWFAPLPRLRPAGTGPATTAVSPRLPPPLDGITVVDSSVAWTGRGRGVPAAVVFDAVEGTASATVRVAGRGFALCERQDQDHLLGQWGDALAGFCSERGPVSKLRWTEWAAPAGLDEQLAYLARHRSAADDSPAVDAYRMLLEGAGPMSRGHEVLVTVTVDRRRLRRRARSRMDAALEEALFDEVRLLGSRLDAAGLVVSLPLTASELAVVLRSRLDPFSGAVRADRKRSLTELAGLVAVAGAGPMAMRAWWDHVAVDGAVHAAFVIAQWPRLEVPANWFEGLLLHPGGIRTVAVVYEPVAPLRSQRHIDRETVKLASDEEQRTRSGFRVGARHRRAQAEVAERESGLVAGYAELEYVGVVVVTATDRAELERCCADYEQAAAGSGVELRRLDGRHDLALACMLPIGRGVAGRRGLG
jgi:hypothetical protein